MRASTLGMIIIGIGTLGAVVAYVTFGITGSTDYINLALAGNAVQIVGFLIGKIK